MNRTPVRILLVLFFSIWSNASLCALLVSSFNTNSILKFDSSTGEFLGTFAGVGGPTGHTFGPDGNFYVASNSANAVLRYSPSGNYLDTVVSGNGLLYPSGLTFGPDGNLYVVSQGTGEVFRYNGITGESLGVFSTVPGVGHRVPIDIKFGPDNNLYLSTQLPNSEILKYDGSTGALIGSFASGGGLSFPASFQFGPDGNLYVNSLGTDSVLRYDGATGAFLDVFVVGIGLNETSGDNSGLVFTANGELLISNAFADNIARFSSATGEFSGFLVASGLGGLDNPTWLTITPVPIPGAAFLFCSGLFAIFIGRSFVKKPE